MTGSAGTLYIVATPIGNLQDITYRAVETLRRVNLIACEDTRQTRKLLDHYEITTPLISLHEHNEAARSVELLPRLKDGLSLALVSDAGTPLISDPGFRLVHDAAAAGVDIVPIPGPSAVLAALAASGLATDTFRFCGFCPRKPAERRRLLESLRDEQATLVLYEAPHRILDTLSDIAAVLHDPPVAAARELTKVHEEFLRGSASEVRSALGARASIKGEFTLLIGKSERRPTPELPVPEAVQALEKQGLSKMDAIKRVARERNLPKREVYRQAGAGRRSA